MDKLSERYLRMTPTVIMEKLAKRRMDDSTRELTFEAYAEEKKKINAAKAKKMQHARLWREFLMPLKAEIKNTKVMLAKGTHEARRLALEDYLDTMEILHAQFMKRVDAGRFTPAQLAAEKAAYISGDGAHWTDWVSATARQQVASKFKDWPRGTRTKIPFERRIPATLHDQLKKRLIKRTEKELEEAKQRVKLYTMSGEHPERLAKWTQTVSRIEQALKWAHELQPCDAVPTTWSGFTRNSLLEEIAK